MFKNLFEHMCFGNRTLGPTTGVTFQSEALRLSTSFVRTLAATDRCRSFLQHITMTKSLHIPLDLLFLSVHSWILATIFTASDSRMFSADRLRQGCRVSMSFGERHLETAYSPACHASFRSKSLRSRKISQFSMDSRLGGRSQLLTDASENAWASTWHVAAIAKLEECAGVR